MGRRSQEVFWEASFRRERFERPNLLFGTNKTERHTGGIWWVNLGVGWGGRHGRARGIRDVNQGTCIE